MVIKGLVNPYLIKGCQHGHGVWRYLLVLERSVLDLVLALGGVNMLPAASEAERMEAEAARCR